MTDEKKRKKKIKPEDDEVSEEDLESVSGGEIGGATHKDSWKGEGVSNKGVTGGSAGPDT